MAFTLTPVKGEDFINRTRILDEMISELSNPDSTSGFALYGRRRIGKTSILKEVSGRLTEKGNIAVVYLSVWDLIDYTVEELCRKLILEIIDAYRPYLSLKFRSYELIKTPLSILRKILSETELKVVYDEIEFIISRNNVQKSRDEMIEHTFTVSEKLSEKCPGNIKCVIMIDEFPSVIDLKSNNIKVGEAILRKIRTISENYQHTALCVSGSLRSTMNLAVLSPGSPFYRQLISKEILPFDLKHTGEILSAGLNITEDCIIEIYNFSAGIPFYIQYIGKMLKRRRPEGGTVTIGDAKETESEFIREEGNMLFREEFNSLSPKEKLVVLKIAKGYHRPKEIGERNELNFGDIRDKISNVSTYLGYLTDKGFVIKTGKGQYELCDPVFERWIREVLLDTR